MERRAVSLRRLSFLSDLSSLCGNASMALLLHIQKLYVSVGNVTHGYTVCIHHWSIQLSRVLMSTGNCSFAFVFVVFFTKSTLQFKMNATASSLFLLTWPTFLTSVILLSVVLDTRAKMLSHLSQWNMLTNKEVKWRREKYKRNITKIRNHL